MVTLSVFGVGRFNFVDILLSGTYLIAICNLSNYAISKLFGAKTNLESALITALILTLIMGPFSFFENIFVLTFVGVVAMASKYVLAVRKKHIFNPAAIAVLLSAIFLNSGATWWIGSMYTLPIIFFGGLLVLTKIKRWELIAGFLTVYFLTIIIFGNSLTLNSFFVPPVWFFVFVMLVEPLTSPSTRNKQIVFGAFAALVYFLLPKVVSGYAYGLETALLAGNLLNFLLSPAFNQILVFRKKEKVAKDTWQFYFEPMSKFKFIPGQYLEWTHPHKNPDSRGVRRYFSISSAPEEENIAITMRIAQEGSSFKTDLLKTQGGAEIMASSPQGEFVLPKDKGIPLAFIAGGIGVTPFRSMVKSMLENDEKRDIIFLYSNSKEEDVAFENLFTKATKVGVKTIYNITEKDGYIDKKRIEEFMPDYKKRVFYISGPEPMVEAFKKMLLEMKAKKIKTDFFPGYTDTHRLAKT